MKIHPAPLVLCVLAAVSLSADVLTPIEQKVVSSIEQRRDAAIDLLARSVNIQSATENHDGVRRVGQLYAAELTALGFETRWVDQAQVGRAGHLVAEHRGMKGTRLLLIGHLDTVLQAEPYRRDGQRAYGSGSSDMKVGNAIAVEALRALNDAGRLADRQVIVVLTGDEEDTGKPYESSRAALVDAAKRSDVALAFEGYEPGTAVVGRRGFSSWRLEVTGSQGHSSTIFGEDRGGGAIFEASRILAAFYAELREPYLTFNPSVVVGGTDVKYDAQTFSGSATGKTNVVPRSVIVEGDLRFLSRGQLDRARAKMRAIVAASLPKTSATISFVDGMPSMEPTDGNRALLATLDQVSRDLGTGPIVAHDPSKRGAGDISFVATMVSGLDGLGGLGAQEHAPGEYTDLAEMTLLTKRAALLMNRLLWAEPKGGLTTAGGASIGQGASSSASIASLDAWDFVTDPPLKFADVCQLRPGGVMAVAGKPLGYMATKRSFKNYRLHAEWRWSETPGNGGVLVHIASGPKDRQWPISIQIQLKHAAAGDLLPMAGATFAEHLSTPPDAKTPQLTHVAADSERPAGEWNTCDIVCQGDSIEVTINGVIQNRVTGCSVREGPIGFQLEGAPFELRNLRIAQ